MASWATVLAISGFHYSAVTGEMSFGAKPATWFWSNGYAWGTVKIVEKQNEVSVTLNVLKGNLHLQKFKVGTKSKTFKKGFYVQEGSSLNFYIPN